MMARTDKLRMYSFRFWVALLAGLMVAGLVAAGIVFAKGLVVTNLSDLVPWGLWITIDLSSIALSAGAFSLCAGVYLLGLERFKPLARTATFIGLIGYSMAVMTLLLDIGRPDRFWHPMVFWNTHSVLWEVTMCVMLYFSVLLLETAPLVGEWPWFKARFAGIAHRLHSIHSLAPYLAVAGLGLSMLHQSSLGAAYGVLKARPIWYRPGISVLFIISAMAGGIALTALVSSLSARISKRAVVDENRVEAVARFVGWVLVAYLYFRFWDAFAMTYTHQPGRDEGLALLTNGRLSFNFWVLELFLGTLLPMVVLLRQDLRRRLWPRTIALGLVVLGVIAYRWDTTLVGQLVVLNYLPNQIESSFAHYFPSLIEILVGAGVVAFGLLSLTLGIRYLNVVDHRGASETIGAEPALLHAGAGAD